jgi:hypothetical protein
MADRSPSLTVITPCCRPQNLVTIHRTLPKGCHWRVVLDRPNLDDVPPALEALPNVEFLHATGAGTSGNLQRNVGLSRPLGDYVYFLDDDNVAHPTLGSVFETYASTGKVIVFHQALRNGRIRMYARPPLAVRRVDCGQVLIPRRFAEELHFELDEYCADGMCFERMYRRHQGEFQFLGLTAAFYNYLAAETSTGGAPVSRRLG